jgi:hypothetical protein
MSSQDAGDMPIFSIWKIMVPGIFKYALLKKGTLWLDCTLV